MLQQFLVGPDPGHMPFVEHDDLVCVLDGADTLGNDQNCGVFCLFCEGFAERRIRFEVQCGKAVIKNIQFRFFHQRPCDGQPLFLAARKIGPALGHKGVDPIRQGPDEIRGLGHLGGRRNSGG